jgi:glycosyltransferase involved in cell wall biosynthesis
MISRPTQRIVRVIARLNVGGPAKHVIWLTAETARAGFDSHLVCGVVPPGEDDMNYFAKTYGVQPIVVPELSREISWRDLIVIWKLYRLFRQLKPDIIHTHTAKAGTVGRVAGLLYRWLPGSRGPKRQSCRILHTYHGHIFHSYYGTVKTRIFVTIEKLLARWATDRIVVISPQQYREIHGDYRVGQSEQFAVIPLGLDLSVFDQWQQRRQKLRDQLQARDDDLLVGIVGRLTEVKNHWLFLLAAALFKDIHARRSASRVRFVIIGDGRLRDALQRQICALKLCDDVALLGTRNDPEYFYPALDIVALTSLNEGTPLSLIEAMANQRPVIATDVGGVADVLGALDTRVDHHHPMYKIHERGVLVFPNHPGGFCDGLARLVEDQTLREQMAERSRTYVQRTYAKQRLVQDVVKLYNDMLQGAA